MPESGPQRAQRILDAAAELVLRWGHKRVTVEEVAKHAAVGKGTVYLHFESRAWMFVCLLMRETLVLVDELAAAVRRDPSAVLMSEQARLGYLGVQRRPLLRAVFGRDGELMGELAHEGAVEPLNEWRGVLADEQFRLLREHGLMRTDLDVATQQYVVGAIQTGFYLHRTAGAAPESVAATLGHTVRAVVEPPGDPDPDALAAAVPAVFASHRRFRDALAAAIDTRPARWPRPRKGST